MHLLITSTRGKDGGKGRDGGKERGGGGRDRLERWSGGGGGGQDGRLSLCIYIILHKDTAKQKKRLAN